MDDDTLDGCDLDFRSDGTPDDDVDLVVLFADCNSPEEVESQKRQWEGLFNES